MKKITRQFIHVLYLALLQLLIFSCADNIQKPKDRPTAKHEARSRIIIKPPAEYDDTLLIDFSAAIFFHPDSIQLSKIKEATDSMVYAGTMHEFFYQMRNARMVIKKTWPGLTMVEAKNHRYLLFIQNDGTRQYIDLDCIKDVYGLFVFNRKKPALLVDMSNIETQISFYLKS
jgi:hypothetical protein